MYIKALLAMIIMSCILNSSCFAQVREIAITIDDLPFVGSANNNPGKLQREKDRFIKIMQTLIDYKVPAIGFVIAGSIETGQWDLLEQFHDAGLRLGNHTYSHKSLNNLSVQAYIEEIERADRILAPLLTLPKYFRYPYLAEGAHEKKQLVNDYLIANNYLIAPVTIDSKDYMFNARLFAVPWQKRQQVLSQIKKSYLSYIWNQTLKAEKRNDNNPFCPLRQVLLIHANLLNSYFLEDVIKLYQQHGYLIVDLPEALEKCQNNPGLLRNVQRDSIYSVYLSGLFF